MESYVSNTFNCFLSSDNFVDDFHTPLESGDNGCEDFKEKKLDYRTTLYIQEGNKDSKRAYYELAGDFGYELKDIFIKYSQTKLQADAKQQNCEAKVHSYRLVLRKMI